VEKKGHRYMKLGWQRTRKHNSSKSLALEAIRVGRAEETKNTSQKKQTTKNEKGGK